MKICDFYRNSKPIVSLEFFLPKTAETRANFFRTLNEVKALQPDYVTLTYGAGGSAREQTVEMAGVLKNTFGFPTAMHLTAVAHTTSEIDAIVTEVRRLGIDSIMALRGDLPKDAEVRPLEQRDFKYAVDLVRHLREHGEWSLGVAGYPEGHPECPSKEEDLRHLKEKVDAGADYVVTQLYFDNRLYFDFVQRARAMGVLVPIVPGVMPISSFSQIQKFASMCGASIPQSLKNQLAPLSHQPEQ
ncbi:MAG: methylenetetrahydrofolate reductase, partial [Elusimicrobia bacterium]|nr:methylenetetrahydrofolate reductase [Elusimicrobiota bacterium]